MRPIGTDISTVVFVSNLLTEALEQAEASFQSHLIRQVKTIIPEGCDVTLYLIKRHHTA